MFGMIRNSLFGTAEVWPCRVLSKGEKDDVAYEERTYEGGMFASVELSGKPFDEALREAVLKLLKYVGGSNDQGAGMGMMAPVCSTVFPAEDGSLQDKVKVLLRIPSQFQDNPPSPSDESIRVEKREEMVVYSTVDRCQVLLENEVSLPIKLISGKKHEVLQNLLVDGCLDPGLNEAQWTNTSR